MLPILAGIGLGLKGLADAEREKRNKQAQAMSDSKAIQFSPWSGLNVSNLVGKDYSSQSPLSALLAGGASGAMTGMNIDNAMADSALAKEKAAYYKSRTPSSTPYSGIMKADAEEDYMGLIKDKARGMEGFNL